MGQRVSRRGNAYSEQNPHDELETSKPFYLSLIILEAQLSELTINQQADKLLQDIIHRLKKGNEVTNNSIDSYSCLLLFMVKVGIPNMLTN